MRKSMVSPIPQPEWRLCRELFGGAGGEGFPDERADRL
jgi:hypothetical protein